MAINSVCHAFLKFQTLGFYYTNFRFVSQEKQHGSPAL